MEYWSVSRGVAARHMTCRECRAIITVGAPIVARDGRKIRLVYHASCFSGSADPRTQTSSSFNQGRLPSRSFADAAPATKGYGKWSTSYGLSGAHKVPTKHKVPLKEGRKEEHEVLKNVSG